MQELINAILNYLVANASTIGAAIVTTLVALLKRWMDKNKIRQELQSRGMNQSDIKKIV